MKEYRCPICACHIEVDELPETCPACKEQIGDKLRAAEEEKKLGMNTATASGPGLVTLSTDIQTVYG